MLLLQTSCKLFRHVETFTRPCRSWRKHSCSAQCNRRKKSQSRQAGSQHSRSVGCIQSDKALRAPFQSSGMSGVAVLAVGRLLSKGAHSPDLRATQTPSTLCPSIAWQLKDGSERPDDGRGRASSQLPNTADLATPASGPFLTAQRSTRAALGNDAGWLGKVLAIPF